MHELERELKQLLIDVLNLEDISVEQIDSEAPLFGAGFGLDSIDALELGVAVRKRYDVKIDADSATTREHFGSIANLARFISGSQSSVARSVLTLRWPLPALSLVGSPPLSPAFSCCIRYSSTSASAVSGRAPSPCC